MHSEKLRKTPCFTFSITGTKTGWTAGLELKRFFRPLLVSQSCFLLWLLDKSSEICPTANESTKPPEDAILFWTEEKRLVPIYVNDHREPKLSLLPPLTPWTAYYVCQIGGREGRGDWWNLGRSDWYLWVQWVDLIFFFREWGERAQPKILDSTY